MSVIRTHHPALALLAAALTVSACATRGPLPTGAFARSPELQQADAAARSEAGREVESMVGPGAISQSESGLAPAAFAAYDTDDDGRLGTAEKASAFGEVYRAMTAIAASKQRDVEELGRPEAVQEYTVAHPLTYGSAEVEVFIDAAEIKPAVFQTIKEAKQTIRMDLFLLGGSEGQTLAELLVQKAKAGVDVRLIHDPGYGLAGTAHAQIVPVMRYLLANGIAVKSYPLAYLSKRRGHPLANKFQIDHNKMVIVDRQTAMIGTMNLIDIGTMNHDLYVRVTGQAAEELAAMHDATWNLKLAKAPTFREPKPEPVLRPTPPRKFDLLGFGLLGDSRAAVARVTKTDIDRQTTKTAVLEAFKSARKSIHVAMFEFGDVDVANALVDAYKRGLDVRVLCDKNANYAKYLDAFKNFNLYGTPNLVTTNILRESGVPVKWYIPQVLDQELHMKLALVDGERIMVGSTNYTYQAFKTFRETNLDIVAQGPAARLELMFQRDWETRGTPVVKPNFFEKCVMGAVKAFDKFNLSWW